MAGNGTLIPALQAHLPAVGHGLPLVADGSAAALATIKLMDDVATLLPPLTIIDAYEAVGANGTKAQATRVALWQQIGDETAGVMALGIRNLSMIWESAWHAADGDATDPAKLKAFSHDDVRALYIKRDFLTSYTLDQIGPILGQPSLEEEQDVVENDGKKRSQKKKKNG